MCGALGGPLGLSDEDGQHPWVTNQKAAFSQLKIDITNQRAAFWVEEGIKDGKDQSEGIILGGGGT